MITAIDTNILIALWDSNDVLNIRARDSLSEAYDKGGLVVCGAVFAELLGGKGRTLEVVERFFDDTSINIEWTIDEAIWRRAANAYQEYAKRRRRQKQAEPKRLVTDFIIGAHASVNGYSLLTFDNRVFSAAFPNVKIADK